MIVVADTGPIHYLILSGQIDLVHTLYGTVILPPAVHRELLHSNAPDPVRAWASRLPQWADVQSTTATPANEHLGPGEREAIALALEVGADFVLMDESLGRRSAVAVGVQVKGTLGVLEDGASRGLIELTDAIRRLRATNIFISDDVVYKVFERHRSRRRS